MVNYLIGAFKTFSRTYEFTGGSRNIANINVNINNFVETILFYFDLQKCYPNNLNNIKVTFD